MPLCTSNTSKPSYPPLTDEQERLVLENQGLIDFAIRRFYADTARLLGHEDMFSVGCIGLVKAARDYDASRGTAFATMAVTYIRTELHRFARENHSMLHIPCHRLANMEVEELEQLAVGHYDGFGIDEQEAMRALEDRGSDFADYVATKADAEAVIAQQTALRQAVIRSVIYDDITLRQVADKFGVKFPRVQQIMRDFREEMKDPSITKRKRKRRNAYTKSTG